MTADEYNDCVKQYADGLYRFMLKTTRQAEDAHDLVQSAFEKLWERRKEVNAATAKSYLFTIAYHKMIDQTRKERRILFADKLPETRATERGPTPGLKQVLEQALERLNERQRSLVMLKDYEGYSYEEISVITGLSLAQVRVNLHRARIQLKEYLVSIEYVL
ncbi:MAG TPA: sigma-70 family RNA polymerase sigma factor [Puia sp.]|nr:sigma-70 family RNA polymerase sigma factor [Puia sp.]